MLELADCLPRQILDRMVSREESVEARSLRRAARGRGVDCPAPGEVDADALALAQAGGLSEADAHGTARAILKLLELERGHRVAIENLIQSLYVEDHGSEG